MPKEWSNKDERQYEHIKQSAGEQGRSSKVAKRIAAATVNKQRSSEGRTKEQQDGGSSSGGSSGRKKASKKTSKKISKKTGKRSKKAGASRGGRKKASKRGGSRRTKS